MKQVNAACKHDFKQNAPWNVTPVKYRANEPVSTDGRSIHARPFPLMQLLVAAAYPSSVSMCTHRLVKLDKGEGENVDVYIKSSLNPLIINITIQLLDCKWQWTASQGLTFNVICNGGPICVGEELAVETYTLAAAFCAFTLKGNSFELQILFLVIRQNMLSLGLTISVGTVLPAAAY